jgi:PKD repeat protein
MHAPSFARLFPRNLVLKLSLSAFAVVLALLPQSASAAILPPITLAWNQNPESDIAGYEVKYGTVNGGTYGNTVSAGNSTTTQVSGLSEGVTYYFVVVAYNTAGLRSDPSAQISYTGINQAPNSTISSPASNTTVTAGQSVSFSGTGSDPDNDTSLTYRWSFGSGSGISDSTSQNAGSKQFNNPGTYVVTFTVTDSKGLADPTPATRTITVSPPVVVNRAPQSTISLPSADISITVGTLLSFAGSGSDPDNDTALTYLWDFGDGSGFADSTSQNPGNRRFNTAGTFVVTFTVTDSLGLADPTPAMRTITVSPPNQAPDSTISSPSSDISITEGGVVFFAGSGSDSDGNVPLTYQWNFGNGSGIADSNELSPGTRIFRTAGTYVVTFTATDSLGLTDQTPATRTITVKPPNQAPDSIISAPITSVSISAGQTVSFSGSGNDPDGNNPLSYLWNFANSGIPNSSSQNPGPLQFNTPGTYQVTLTVTDSLGLADPTPATQTVTVTTAVANRAPDSVISLPALNTSITAGSSLTFNGVGSDPDGNTPLTYLWNFGNNSGIANSNAQNPGAKKFNNPGTYLVTFTAIDSKGFADPSPATRTITVTTAPSNQPPDAVISAPAFNVSIKAGETVTFESSASDPDGNNPLTYLWNFGAGSDIANSTKQNPGALQFVNPGVYQVSLTVSDARGLADPSPATRTVTVMAPPPPSNQAPESMISAPVANISITAGASVPFSGSGTDPDGNTRLTYRWTFGAGSGIADSTKQNPGSIQFNKPGVYQVSLTVTDSQGLADPTPALRTITVTDPKSNQAPDSVISSPAGDVSIIAGGAVVFYGGGTDPDGNSPLSYLWNFGNESGVPDSSAQNPGLIQFDRPGTYEVSLTVTDAKGLADPSPAKRKVTVLAPAPPIPGLEGWIDQPASNLTISVGDSVTFSGYGVDRYRWSRINYYWNFGAGSGIPDSRRQYPGTMQFNNPGVYEVSMTVINSRGQADPSPARVTILVTEPAPLPKPELAKEMINDEAYPTFTVTKPLVDDKRVRTVEVSSDLKTWHSGPDHVTIITDDERTLKVRAKKPMGDTPCCYFRLRTDPAPSE